MAARLESRTFMEWLSTYPGLVLLGEEIGGLPRGAVSGTDRGTSYRVKASVCGVAAEIRSPDSVLELPEDGAGAPGVP